jgi:PASTA domain
MNQEHESTQDNSRKKKKKRKIPAWVSLLVFPVIVTILGAVLVTAFTPLGASLRELLFHTRATVSGSVTVDGSPAVNVQLKLDGADEGNSDADGRFLLADVGKGQHRLHLEFLGAQPRDEVFSVASGQTVLQVGNLEMEPLVRLAYTPSVHLSPAQEFDYDVTLWIIGDPHVLSRIKSVSYTLPTPLSPRPVSGAGTSRAFCYRQTGSWSFQDLPSGGGGPVLAWATVDLGAGRKFRISSPAGTAQPPDCPEHQADSAAAPSTTPSSGQPTQVQGRQQAPPSTQSSSSPASSPTQLVPVPNVINQTAAEATAILEADGFKVQINTLPAPPDQGGEPGTVYNQNPGSDQDEPKGKLIQIFVPPLSVTTMTPTPAPTQSKG